MKSLLVTLSVFFVLVIGSLAFDKFCNGCITGRGVVGSAALGAVIVWWHHYRIRRQAQEAARNERLRRNAETLLRLHRLTSDRGESCGMMIVVCLAVVVVVLFLLSGLVRAEGCGFDGGLRTLTAELTPDTLLTADELDDLRALTLSTALLIRRMQTPPSGMKADLQNKRIRTLRQLETITETLIGITVDHAGTVLRRQSAGGAK